MANNSLTSAKRAKNDEFYTQYADIQKEIEAYLEYDPETFKGKVVYCNCDDPYESNFFRYFVLNFKKLGLKHIHELSRHFNSVIDWVSTVFSSVEKEMQGLEWGRLYTSHHHQPYSPDTVAQAVMQLYGDPSVKNRRGVFEYILGGSSDTRLLEIRVFEDATKRAVYQRQTDKASGRGLSNCPLCAVGHDANTVKIWNLSDMDADHVAAWSKGGSTDIKNCQMLCKTHNRAKGNR